MARRQRVPRHKEHRRKRNKNPKLSPFQREQQRAKLANQAPTSSLKNGAQRDYPVSQRAVMEYLIAKQKRRLEKKQQREKGLEEKRENLAGTEERVRDEGSITVTKDDGSLTPPSLATSAVPPEREACGTLDVCRTKEDANKKKKKEREKVAKKTSLVSPVALNAVLSASLPRPIMAFKTRDDGSNDEESQPQTVEAIIARKKEKKHRKKVEARRERVRALVRETERQLQEEVLSTKSSKRRKKADPVAAKDVAFERKLKQMQKEKEAKDAAEKRAAGGSKQGFSKRDRKRITFSDGDAAGAVADAPHSAMRYPNDKKGSKAPREFYELVDVVRHGERVEAPPVFDALPRHDNSVTRLASRMRLLSSATSSKGKEATGGAARELSKREEMERLRETVMATYRRTRREKVDARKGVDMHHQFPVFS